LPVFTDKRHENPLFRAKIVDLSVSRGHSLNDSTNIDHFLMVYYENVENNARLLKNQIYETQRFLALAEFDQVG